MIDTIFPDNSPLRVRRVRNYRVPRYPDHNDPDPTTTPEPIPYPWKSGVAAALLALGNTSCEKKEVSNPEPPLPPPQLSERVISPEQDRQVDQIVAAALRDTPKGDQNPFALELGFSGLPHVSSSFGTGEPTPLDSVLAQRLITKLFTAEGLKTQSTTFKEDGFTANVQGYDPEKRIGFFIGDWNNMAQDASSSWMISRIENIASGQRKFTPVEEKQAMQDMDEMSAFLLGDGRDYSNEADLQALRKHESVQAKALAYLSLAAKRDVPRVSMAEIEHAEKMAEDKERYLAIITVFDRRFQSFGPTPPEYQKLEAIRADANKRTFASSAAKDEWIREQQAPMFAEMANLQLVKLAESVREYIAWARRNGLQ